MKLASPPSIVPPGSSWWLALASPRFYRVVPPEAGRLTLQVMRPPGQKVALEATGALGSEAWTPILTNTIPSGRPLDLIDPDILRFRARYYYRFRFGR